MDKKWVSFYILLSVFVFLVRSFFFAHEFGGIEHDSGWFLGVARNLAQRGIYASYTNTIKEEFPGPYPSLHGRYSVQDESGFSYFPAGVTVGPGFVIPEALMMRIFGYDWWQFRLWPLISFAGLLLVIFHITHKLGGFVGLLVLQIWLWFTPKLFIQFSYESFGEHTALFYLLFSFYLAHLSYVFKKRKFILLGLSGFFFSLSILTKYIFLTAGLGFGAIFLWELFRGSKRFEVLKHWAIWLFFLLLPIVIYQIYSYTFLLREFGKEAWDAVNKDFILHFKNNGGGLDLSIVDRNFLSKKAGFWQEVGAISFFAWLVVFLSPLAVLKNKKKDRLVLFTLIFSAFLPTVTWFLFFSSTGWTRHVWHGLVIGMLLISLAIGRFQSLNKLPRLVVLILVLVMFSRTPFLLKEKVFEPKIFLNDEIITKWLSDRYERGLQGLPTNVILPLNDQIELQQFFKNQIREVDRIYYAGWFLVAEASPIVDKVFFSLDRYLWLGQVNPDNGSSYLILGPYQKGPHSIMGSEYHDRKVIQLCKDIVFENPSYTLCSLRTGLLYENRAYD